jgi:hypothetical protein
MTVFASIGECMVELSSAGDGLYRRGFAGDTFNTAWTLRGLTDPAAVQGTAALADEPDATRLCQLRQLSAPSGVFAAS